MLLPNENKQLSPYMTFYLITTMQVGVGILGFERYIAKSAGHDAWMAVIISGLSFSVLIWICYKILLKENNDIISVHKNLFGKWFGGLLSIFLLLYFFGFVVTILRTYIEVIQIWMFPELATWVIAVLLLLVAYSFVIGGLRVVTGLCLLGFFYTIPLFLLKYYALKEGHFYNLLPIMDHSIKEIFSATKAMTLNNLGIELILIYFPFIKQAKKSHKWAQFGNLFTLFTYLITALVSFVYFNQEQLQHTIWGTLTLWKIVDLPFAQRFEFAGIAIWLFVILPNICLGLWAISRGLRQLFSMKQKTGLLIISTLVFISCILLIDRQQIDLLNTTVSKAGFYIVYFYIPLLFIFQVILTKVRNKKHA